MQKNTERVDFRFPVEIKELMTNTELPLKSRKIIAKEMRKYV